MSNGSYVKSNEEGHSSQLNLWDKLNAGPQGEGTDMKHHHYFQRKQKDKGSCAHPKNIKSNLNIKQMGNGNSEQKLK